MLSYLNRTENSVSSIHVSHSFSVGVHVFHWQYSSLPVTCSICQQRLRRLAMELFLWLHKAESLLFPRYLTLCYFKNFLLPCYREVATLSRLQHQHVVRYYQVCDINLVGAFQSHFLSSRCPFVLQCLKSNTWIISGMVWNRHHSILRWFQLRFQNCCEL